MSMDSMTNHTCSMHVWQKLEEREDKKLVLVCRSCGATKLANPPVEEQQKDQKPLLME